MDTRYRQNPGKSDVVHGLKAGGVGATVGRALALLLVVASLAGCASGNSEKSPLTTWHDAVANRASAPARWLALGDSITEGQGASARSQRWLNLTLDQLRKTNPVSGTTGGAGYVPAQFAVYGPDSTWANWATATTGTAYLDLTTPDLGYRSLALEAGATRTYSFSGTGLDLWWARYPGSGAFTYDIDDGAPRSVKTDGAVSASTLTRVDGLTRGRHSVTVTATSAFTLEGFTFYDGDRDKGISLYDSAHSGATIATFTEHRKTFLDAVRRVSPSLITITLGGNDAQKLTPKQLQSQYLSLLRSLIALPSKPSVLVVGEFTPGPSMTTNIAAPWADYLAAIRRATTSVGVDFVSMNDTFPVATTSGRGIYSTDGIHPNDKGQRKIARLVLKALK